MFGCYVKITNHDGLDVVKNIQPFNDGFHGSSKSRGYEVTIEKDYYIGACVCAECDDSCVSAHYVGACVFFEHQYRHRRSYTRAYTHPYERTHAHPTPMSTSERLSRHIILRFTKSP